MPLSPMKYFQWKLFFLSAFFVCKTIGNLFLPTELAREYEITNERYVNGRFP